MIRCNICILEEFDALKKKERLEKEYIEKEKVDTVFILTFNNSSSFDFLDSLLFAISDIKLEALLADMNTSNRMLIISQSN